MTVTFGFTAFPWSRFEAVEEIAECAQVADTLGFAATHVPCHLLPPAWPDAPAATKLWHDPITMATFLAARTSRLVIETTVLVIPYYPPIQLAKAVATADVLSQGRIRLGVGSGWMRAEFRRLGIDYDQRGSITDEYLRAMRALWTEDRPKFDGRWVSFENVSFLPRPTREDGIPIVVGGSGPRPFRRVAELGVGWHPLSGGAAAVRSGLDEIEPLMRARGRAVGDLHVGYTFAAGDDPELADMNRQPHGAGGLGDHATAAGPRGSGRFPVEACIRGIAELADAGVNHVLVSLAWHDAASLVEELRWFAAEVMPAFA
jgi:probable F420-dependent oxidoreductase